MEQTIAKISPASAELFKKMYSFMKKKLNFKEDVKCTFLEDEGNAANLLGKTAYYVPATKEIYVFVTKRHPKDFLRSVAHELVHHEQNLRGSINNKESSNTGYAQEDTHLREMEREAYERGNMLFRDFEDGIKKENEHMDREKMMSAIHEAIAGVLQKYKPSAATSKKIVAPTSNVSSLEEGDSDLMEGDIEKVEEKKETFMPIEKEHLAENKLKLNEKLLKTWCK